jgi:hypothetical protein
LTNPMAKLAQSRFTDVLIWLGFSTFIASILNTSLLSYNASLTRIFQSAAAKNVGLKLLLGL